MSASIKVKWVCPHCGIEQITIATVNDGWGNAKTELVYCDTDLGGCDAMVAVQPQITVTSKVYKLEPADAA